MTTKLLNEEVAGQVREVFNQLKCFSLELKRVVNIAMTPSNWLKRLWIYPMS